jgi:hypothetical protein
MVGQKVLPCLGRNRKEADDQQQSKKGAGADEKGFQGRVHEVLAGGSGKFLGD